MIVMEVKLASQIADSIVYIRHNPFVLSDLARTE